MQLLWRCNVRRRNEEKQEREKGLLKEGIQFNRVMNSNHSSKITVKQKTQKIIHEQIPGVHAYQICHILI